MAGLALLLSLTAAAGAQPSPASPGIASDLAGRIAAAIAPATELALTIAVRDANEIQRVELRNDLVRALNGRGIHTIESSRDAASASVSCGTNLRERVCIAEITRHGGERVVATASQPNDSAWSKTQPQLLFIDVSRVFGQRAPILDVGASGDRLFVLDPAALTLYRRGGGGWQRRASGFLNPPQPWPRDVRGRIRIESNTIDAFLPGVTCRADLDLTRLSCAEDRGPWPLGIENSGIDASRNFFTTPEGLPFYGVAPLDENYGGALLRWLIVDRSGALRFLDASRQPVSVAGNADDVAGLRAPCGSLDFVLVSSRARGARTDSLQLFQVLERQLVPAAPAREMPGTVTAVWAAPGSTVATVVTHDSSADRYEAFQVGIACDR